MVPLPATPRPAWPPPLPPHRPDPGPAWPAPLPAWARRPALQPVAAPVPPAPSASRR